MRLLGAINVEAVAIAFELTIVSPLLRRGKSRRVNKIALSLWHATYMSYTFSNESSSTLLHLVVYGNVLVASETGKKLK